ncbi:hypothetical protein HanRHA438_Chr13g0587461 [Helianthus annuus]|nr:hypothetical protein HanRHA438_Chr13g0587461 [Helianthus annuus]
MAEMKVRTREEILSEKTYRERNIAGNGIDEMQEEYENVVSNKRRDKKRECYVNRDGEPVVPKRDKIHDDVLLVIPRFGEYYSNAAKDKTYAKRLEKIIRHAMTSSLRKRDEERMKKNVENLVDNLKKVVEEIKVEAVKWEDKDANQTDAAENTKVPIIEVNSNSEILKEIIEQCKKCMEPCSACTEKDEKFKTRNLEFNKIEEVFKNKCKEMLENEKVLKDNDEKLSEKCKKLEKENEVLKENVLKMTEECSQKENVCQEMKKEYDSITLAYHITKKSYEDVKGQMKLVQSRLRYYSETTDTLKRQYEIKQQVVNSYIEDVAKLKREIADLEQDNNKLKSYHASLYVLERIFNIKPGDDDSEKNKKGIGSKYHQVPPPEKFAFYDEEKVEKAFNMVDQLPDNIDVTYSKSDDSNDSEVVGKVVESVLKEESVDTGKSESHDENEGSFHEEYMKNSKSEKNLNADSK